MDKPVWTWGYQESEMRWLGSKTRFLLTKIVPEAIEDELWLTKEKFDKLTNLDLYFMNRKYMFKKGFRWRNGIWFYLPEMMWDEW